MELRLSLTLQKVLTAAALGLISVCPAPASARLSHLTDLFVFGDSLADTGNAFALSADSYPPSPYYQGRASNGPLSVEYLWQHFNPGNESFRASQEGGTNYAILGASTGLESFNSVAPSIPDELKPLYEQKANAWSLDEFERDDPFFEAETSLFVVWLFPNDVLYWLRTGGALGGPGLMPGTFDGDPAEAGDVEDLIANGIGNITGTIVELAGRDARNFLVPYMPDLGLTPLFLGTPASAQLSFITEQFNHGLALALGDLELTLPTVDIIQFRTDQLLENVLEDPAAFGFTNVTEACIDGLVVTPECEGQEDKYLFWDDFHPTTAAHRIFGRSFYTAVSIPVPGPLPVMGLGVAFGWSRRLRRRSRAGSQGWPGITAVRRLAKNQRVPISTAPTHRRDCSTSASAGGPEGGMPRIR